MKCSVLSLILLVATICRAQEMPPELEQLEEQYQAAVSLAVEPINQAYISRLTQLRQSYTVAGKLDEALAVDRRLKALTGEASAAPAYDPAGVDVVADANIRGEKVGDEVVLPPGGTLESAKKFAPPIEITYVIRTEENNIRLGYAASEIIFNWEENPEQLRVGGGPAGGMHVDGAGSVRPRRFETITQIVLPDRMILKVGNRVRAEFPADFSGIFEEIGVRAVDSQLTVQEVTARQLPPEGE